MKKRLLFFLSFLAISWFSFAQNVGVNTDGTAPTELFHVKSTAASQSHLLVQHTLGAQELGLRLLNSNTGSADWKLYIPGSTSELRFRNTGSDRVTFLANGNVGIGTTAPLEKFRVVGKMFLDVNSTYAGNASLISLAIGDDDTGLDWGGDGTIDLKSQNTSVGRWKYYSGGEESFGFGTTTTSNTDEVIIQSSGNTSANFGLKVKNSAATDQFVVRSDGNVGVGITAPLSLLHSVGNLTIGNGATAGSIGNIQITTGGASPASNRLTFGTDGTGWQFRIAKNQAGTVTDYFTVQDNGNVGIGTTGPLQRLHLVGTARISTLASNSVVRSDANGDLSSIALTNASDVLLGNGTFGSLPGRYSLPNTGGSAQWVKLGTLTISQQGKSAYIKVVSNLGYNASVDQNFEVNIRFKTSNGGSVDANGFAGDGSYYFTGRNNQFATNGRIKIVANIGGTGATAFDLYLYFGSFTGDGSFYTVETSTGTWAHSGALGQADPGAASSTVLWPTQEFNIGSNFLVVNSVGNVGIGSATPGAKLDVVGNLQINSTTGTWGGWYNAINFPNASHAALVYPTGGLLFGLHSNTNFYWANTTAGTYSMILGNTGNLTLGTNTFIAGSSGTSYFNAGNVGIGTTSPSELLHVTRTADVNKYVIRGDAAQTTTSSDYENVGVYGYGRGGNSGWGLGAGVMGIGDMSNSWYATGVYAGLGTGAIGLPMVDAALYANGASLGPSGVFMNGNVGIGITNPSYQLHVSGRIRTTGVNESSDVRLKKNIETIGSPLAKVEQLRGVFFNWRTDEFKTQHFDTNRQMGVIAQEIEKIIPEVVCTDADGYKSVEYSKLVGLLIEAIKELNIEVKEKEEMINLMRAEIDRLKNSDEEKIQQLQLEIENINQILELKSEKK